MELCTSSLPGNTVTEILDFYHATEHVWAVAHTAWPEDAAAAKVWADRTGHALRHGGAEGLETAWTEWPTPLAAAAQAGITRERGYFTYRRERIQYPRYEQRGLPIGSGMVESACKSALKQRESESGMRGLENGVGWRAGCALESTALFPIGAQKRRIAA